MSQHKTLQLQRAKIKSVKVASQKQVSVGHRDEVNKLKSELASTQKDLADEIEASKKRELRVQSLQETLAALKKHQLEQEGCDKHEHNMRIKTLVKQRDELLLVVKRQIKLIEVLRQQRLHVESAAKVLEVKC